MYRRLLFFWVWVICSAACAADRPNILWITSEDNGPQLGCYGDSYATTPNIDRLAAKGVIYRYCWSNRARVRTCANGDHFRLVPAKYRGRTHAQPDAAARRFQDVSAVPAGGRVLLYEQRQGRLQPREAGQGLGCFQRQGTLAESGRRAAVFRHLQHDGESRKSDSQASSPGNPRPGIGSRAGLSSGPSGSPPGLGPVLRQADGDGRVCRRSATRGGRGWIG